MEILNLILKKIEYMLHWVIGLLPKSPFVTFYDVFSDLPYLSYINYFIPIGTIIAITEAWVTAIALYYVYSVILRWVKAIQ